MRKKTGKITIMPGVENVLPWEMHSAMAIIKLGIDVTFKPRHMSSRSADAYYILRKISPKLTNGVVRVFPNSYIIT